MIEPKTLAESLERNKHLPRGYGERFSGYGVMGLTFSSRHVLCMRRFPASSLGQPYTSVWHRNPDGVWTFIQDVPPEQSCPRYFGNAVSATLIREIEIQWTGAREFSVKIEGDYSLDWKVSLADTAGTRFMNVVGQIIPERIWQHAAFLRLIGEIGSHMLGAGRLRLIGKVPNGQNFVANPRYVWMISSSSAKLRGKDLGKPGPLPVQANLGDLWIPQSGRFFVGYAFLESFDPARHLSGVSRQASTG